MTLVCDEIAKVGKVRAVPLFKPLLEDAHELITLLLRVPAPQKSRHQQSRRRKEAE